MRELPNGELYSSVKLFDEDRIEAQFFEWSVRSDLNQRNLGDLGYDGPEVSFDLLNPWGIQRDMSRLRTG